MQEKRIVLLNGPPRCGKDTLANMLEQRHGFKHLKITSKLKEKVHGLYGMPDKRHDAFDKDKDKKLPQFLNLTPRQAYIEVWNKYLVPMHGENFLVDDLITDIDNMDHTHFVISDVGFNRESKAFFNYYHSQCLLFTMHRPGHSYMNDIRSYVDRETTLVHTESGVSARMQSLTNSKTPEHMLNAFRHTYHGVFLEALHDKS